MICAGRWLRWEGKYLGGVSGRMAEWRMTEFGDRDGLWGGKRCSVLRAEGCEGFLEMIVGDEGEDIDVRFGGGCSRCLIGVALIGGGGSGQR